LYGGLGFVGQHTFTLQMQQGLGQQFFNMFFHGMSLLLLALETAYCKR